MMASYVYAPLLPSQHESAPGDFHIRLLELHLGEPGEDISCSLSSHKLSEAPKYEAVSYCWGDRGDRAKIMCDGKPLQIQSNVKNFLQRTRAKGTPRTLWIDGICINQADDVEKGHQVERMKDIYENADRTLIWFGKGSSKTALGMDFARKLFNAMREAREGKSAHRWYRFRNEFTSLSNPGWEAFSELLNCPWFTRAWIVQEVAVAKDPWVLCGSHAVGWSTIVGAIIYVINYHSYALERFAFPHLSTIVMLWTSQAEFANRKEYHHYQILARHRQAAATDPLDKVYAFYGLSSQASFKKTGIKPDYTITPEELYIQLARATLEAQGEIEGVGNLDYLCIPRLPSLRALPSWAPDWGSFECKFQSSLLGLEALDHAKAYPYKATSSSFCDLRDAIDSNNCLHLFGYIVDTIATVSGTWEATIVESGKPTLLEQAHMLKERQRRVRDWEGVLGGRNGGIYTPTGEKYLEVMWKTCTTGIYPEGEDKARAAFKMFLLRQNALRLLEILGLHVFIYTWILVVFIEHVLFNLGIPNPETAFRMSVLCMNERKATRTVNGYVGMVPGMARAGDSIALLQGGKVPFIIRPKEDDWELIGDAYIHGAMLGELWNEAKCKPIRLV